MQAAKRNGQCDNMPRRGNHGNAEETLFIEYRSLSCALSNSFQESKHAQDIDPNEKPS